MPVSETCVLHVLPANSGGVDRHVRDICSLRSADAMLHVTGAQLVIETPSAPDFIAIDRAHDCFANITDRVTRPLLLHAHSTLAPTRTAVAALAALWRCPYVLTLHDIDFGSATDETEARARTDFVLAAAERLVPSDYVKRLLHEGAGSRDVTCEVVVNGVDCPVPATDLARPVHHAGQFPVAVVGALGEHKGWSFLREVIAALPSDLRVVLIGYVEGQLTPGWLLDERLWVHGAFETAELSAVLDHYGSRLVFFPNRQPESFSYTLSDVWCAQRPALVPAAGALGDRVEAGGGGWSYRTDADGPTVAAHIERLLREIASTGAPHSTEPAFGVRSMVDAIENIYLRHAPAAALEAGDWRQLRSIAATHLDGGFFRAELRRLAGDLTFANAQYAAQAADLQALEREFTGRGDWIARLEADNAELRVELATVQAAAERALNESRTAHRLDVEKLTRDVNETLAAAHRYERALGRLPAWLRSLVLCREDASTPSRDGGEKTGD